jgi:hypothetical protein
MALAAQWLTLREHGQLRAGAAGIAEKVNEDVVRFE